jgi:hypothetical protein
VGGPAARGDGECRQVMGDGQGWRSGASKVEEGEKESRGEDVKRKSSSRRRTPGGERREEYGGVTLPIV